LREARVAPLKSGGPNKFYFQKEESTMQVVQKKICLLGDFSVGKTSLVRRFVEGHFDDKYLSTIGVRISRKPLTRPYGTLNLLVWDLAGSAEFSTQSSYLVGVAGALIVCDLTRRETLAGCAQYVQQVWALNAAAPLVLVCNKVDLVAARALTEADLQRGSEAFGGQYVFTSAKTGEGVESAFELLAGKIEVQP
jgi:small GTP-binding protein